MRHLVRFVVLSACISTLAVPLGSATSASATDVPLVQGVVIDAVTGSSKVDAGAIVSVSWEPGAATAHEGDELAIVPVGTTTTDEDGQFSLSVAPSPQMEAEAALNGGWVNLDVGVVDPSTGRVTSSTISRRVVDQSWADPGPVAKSARIVSPELPRRRSDELPAVPSAEAPSLQLTLTGDSRQLSESLVQRYLQMVRSTSERAASIAQLEPPPHCYWVTDSTPTRDVNVLEFHNASNANASWSYGQNADSDVQVGLFKFGEGWNTGATVHIGTSIGSQVGVTFTDSTPENAYGQTSFEFIYEHVERTDGAPDGSPCPFVPDQYVGDKLRRATKWVGGAAMNDSLPGAEYVGCNHKPQSENAVHYIVGAWYRRAKRRAAMIYFGADVGPISVGAQSGYSHDVELFWRAKRGNGINLCGTNNFPAYAGVIHASNAD